MIENNYYIILQKNKKLYSVKCNKESITVIGNNITQNIVDVDGNQKEYYWIKCLNLIRKNWGIISATDIPSFDVSYTPNYTPLPVYNSKVHKIQEGAKCIIVPNGDVYFYDVVSKCIWENNNKQVYFPKHILKLFHKFNKSFEFVYESNERIYILEYDFDILENNIMEYAPRYSFYKDALVAITQNHYLWSKIRFIDDFDIDINVFLHIVHS